MRKVNVLLIIIAMFFIIFLTGCKKETCKITLIAKSKVETIEVEKGTEYAPVQIRVDGYVFVGWYTNEKEKFTGGVINDNITLTGKYIKEGTTYNITYILNGGELPEDSINSYVVGEEVILNKPYGFGQMEFLGWYLNDEQVESIDKETYGDICLEARWNDQNVYYDIEYNLDGGIIESSYKTRYIEGDAYLLPVPKKDGYRFKGWYLEETFETRIKRITSEDKQNFKLYAKFEERNQENTYISFFGDSITTYAGFIPENFATYYPTPGCDVDSVEKTWWHMAATKAGYKILANNSYSGTLVSSGANLGNNYERISYLEKNGIDPDIVVIFMGTNDLTRSVNVNKFKSSYASMIDKIKEEYDDVEIYIVNLPYNKYGTSYISLREKYNVAFEELANEKGAVLIDITGEYTVHNVHEMMFAGGHPSYKGMQAIADLVWKAIR